MRRNYIAGNWKMNKTIAEAVALAEEIVTGTRETKSKVMIAPPFTALKSVREVLQGSGVLLGAQNMGSEENGAHTGEISVLMLKEAGADTVILGHSERRHIYGESGQLINKKVTLALSHQLAVVLCVGETLEEREGGVTERIVENQVRDGLSGITEQDLEMLTVAYEPVWAIGTGKTATPEDADAVHRFIRELITEIYTARAAANLTIQYGGSVKPGNIKALMAMENIDGALVGGASLTAESFLPIVNFDV